MPHRGAFYTWGRRGMNGSSRDYLVNIQKIKGAVLDMNGIGNESKKTILTYMALVVFNGWHLACGKDAEVMLQTALWNLTH
jgi:hypothetical protein